MSKTIMVKGDERQYFETYFNSKLDIFLQEKCEPFEFEADRYVKQFGTCLELQDRNGNTAQIHDGWYDMDARECSDNLQGLGIENLGPDDIPVTHSHIDMVSGKIHFECLHGDFKATFSALACESNFDIVTEACLDDKRQISAHAETLAMMATYYDYKLPQTVVTKEVQENLDYHSLMIKEDIKTQESELYL